MNTAPLSAGTCVYEIAVQQFLSRRVARCAWCLAVLEDFAFQHPNCGHQTFCSITCTLMALEAEADAEMELAHA